ncbi:MULTISPECIES: response regulator transcription factor [Actinomadura]|uniref:Response regulator transcription factor n=1 Tax=Actinomadura yumaensis TaxID=111807 RepID=A0ABW2CNN6_9ACTN|nr:response regulator transcription factor [Actinomadura sp. J1-007]
MSGAELDGAGVLVVDDQAEVREALADGLRISGYEVRTEADGDAALRAAAAWFPDVMIVDVMMPGTDGLAVCRALRARGDRTPVLVLTALDAVSDRIEGLDAGADDYLVKPFDLGELVARVRALLRRSRPGPARGFADLTVDPETRTGWRGGRRIEFTLTEWSVLEVLLEHPGRTLSRGQIGERVWGLDFGPSSNSLEVYIGYLRRKLEAGGEPRLVHTVRGLGYRLGEP